jgi:hypothetical protein
LITPRTSGRSGVCGFARPEVLVRAELRGVQVFKLIQIDRRRVSYEPVRGHRTTFGHQNLAGRSWREPNLVAVHTRLAAKCADFDAFHGPGSNGPVRSSAATSTQPSGSGTCRASSTSALAPESADTCRGSQRSPSAPRRCLKLTLVGSMSVSVGSSTCACCLPALHRSVIHIH